MKKMRRFAAIAAAAAMTACMTVPMMSMMSASAASDYVITVENNIDGMENTKYVAYKILDVSYDEGKTAYTYSVPENGLLTEAQILAPKYNGTAAFTKMSDLYTWLNDATNKEVNARTFADTLYTTYSNTFVEANGISGTDSIDTGSTGYYLVTGTVTDSNDNAIVSSVILTTMDPVATISPKLDAPTHTKKIQHNETEEWGVVGDNQIGDTVNYRITTSMPDPKYVAAFDGDYVYTIHDEMTKGLDFDASTVEVMLGTQKLTANTHYTVKTSCEDVEVNRKDGQKVGESFEVEFNLAKIIEDFEDIAVDGAEFVTSYSCTLTTEALVAATAGDDNNSNDNTSHLEYSNNPYSDTTANTADVTVYDWTFTYDVIKYKNEAKAGNELKGAGFTIYEGSTALKFTQLTGTNTYVVDPAGTVEQIETPDDGAFKLVGLDDETEYKIVETKVPSGYNKAEDITFKISNTYDGTPVGSNIATLTDNRDGDLTEKIVNKSGTQLPSTGGIGTTLFYVIGGTMAAGAGVALIAKKRMKNEE